MWTELQTGIRIPHPTGSIGGKFGFAAVTVDASPNAASASYRADHAGAPTNSQNTNASANSNPLGTVNPSASR
ncbi:hypothetical protein CH289_10420 [Rhodococcus sp. RS1C4]|nr:hypothetical protein CH289_10420 [Rhodococcus sp. RS1C4]